jgi:DNA polymerase (family X)
MENVAIAVILDEIADLLEIKGGVNPFRIRAYRNAVRTIETTPKRLADLAEAGVPLSSLQGIGKEMERHILEIIQTGGSQMLRDLWEEVPRSTIQLVKLTGVGPRKAKQLWDALQVDSIEMLEQEIKAGRVAKVKGFGEKTAQKLLAAIEARKGQEERLLRPEVERLAAAMREHISGAPGVCDVVVAGSFRRLKETVADLDLLARCDGEALPVMEHFVSFPGAVRVEAAGPTKASLILRTGFQIDLRVVPAESFGAALHYFTGSKEHNVKLRQIALKKKLKLSEWGVFKGDERIAGATEEEVFAALGLPFIPPELREDRGELEAAAAGKLPKLIEQSDMKGDLQMHSTWSDGRASIEDMARGCREMGYEYFALTDHTQALLTLTNGLTPERVQQQWEEIDEVREKVPGIAVLKSLEIDILREGQLDMPDWILEGLDVVVVSVHSLFSMEQSAMTKRVLKAIEHPLVDILAHPTGRRMPVRPPYALDVEAVLQLAKETGVAVELNATPNRLDLSDVHVRRAKELGVKVAISTDAHSIRGLATMRYGIEQARRGWLEKDDVINTMNAKAFKKWLARKQAAIPTRSER